MKKHYTISIATRKTYLNELDENTWEIKDSIISKTFLPEKYDSIKAAHKAINKMINVNGMTHDDWQDVSEHKEYGEPMIYWDTNICTYPKGFDYGKEDSEFYEYSIDNHYED